MTPTASPRHPWKALAVVLLVFAAVHGAGAHASFGDHDAPSHIHVVHADPDCEHVHIDINGTDIDVDDDSPDDDAVFDVFDDDDWS